MARSPDPLGFSALQEALEAIMRAAEANPTAAVVRRIRDGLAAHAEALEFARAATDPIRMPRVSFDPSNPKTIGRMVSLALIAQPLVPLSSVTPAYGSGVYAIYYKGDHPLYARVSNTETPIYVGKADPSNGDASTSREQGPKLTGRLVEHAGTIAAAEAYSDTTPLPSGLHPIRLSDFTCRRLVCATNAQLAAEKHLILTFWPVWNSDTKACWGMSKHGDSANTRTNKRSPWDVVHPGRPWALDARLVNSMRSDEIQLRIDQVFQRCPPRTDRASLVEEMLAAFRQEDESTVIDEIPPPLGEVAHGIRDCGVRRCGRKITR